MERVDIAIVGSGPAGISAAINAKIRNKTFYLFGNSKLSEKVYKSKELQNVTGISPLNGKEMVEHLHKRLKENDIQIIEETISGIYKMGKYYSLLVNEKEYQATTIILCTGVETIQPLPNELELLGRGVSYCATCDGNLYKGKDIAIISDSIDNEDEVEYLADLAQKVYYFPLFKGSNMNKENIEMMNLRCTKILGANYVEGIECNDSSVIQLDGVFFLKQSISPSALLSRIEMDGNHIKVNRNMETNLAGCFAAGDCTGTPYQIDKAFGEGNIALHSAVKYLSNLKK